MLDRVIETVETYLRTALASVPQACPSPRSKAGGRERAPQIRVLTCGGGVVGARRIELLTSSTSTQHAGPPTPRAAILLIASRQASSLARRGAVVRCRAALVAVLLTVC
jgi:hypothetical protein